MRPSLDFKIGQVDVNESSKLNEALRFGERPGMYAFGQVGAKCEGKSVESARIGLFNNGNQCFLVLIDNNCYCWEAL